MRFKQRSIKKNITLSILVSFTLLACLLTVDSPAFASRVERYDGNSYYRAPKTIEGKTILMPIGTTFEGRINSTLGSRKSHPGQRFSIIMSSPVLANGVDVILPAGSEIIGEVVEAIPSSSLKRKRRMPPPRGKLRVQLNGLRTPDGLTYPLVASLVGEIGRNRGGVPLGTSVAYMGSATAFEAVSPGSVQRGRSQRGLQVLSRREMLNDPLLGLDERSRTRFSGQESQIRSLTVKNHDYLIQSGSPLSVRLDAPLRIAIPPASLGAGVTSPDAPESEADSLAPSSSSKNVNNEPGKEVNKSLPESAF